MILLILFLLFPFLIGSVTWLNLFGKYQLTKSSSLSTNSWHFKFMKWCLRPFTEIGPYTFRGLCNYAWALYAVITFSALFALAQFLIFIFVVCGGFIGGIFEKASDYCSSQLDLFHERVGKQMATRVLNATGLNGLTRRLLDMLNNNGYTHATGRATNQASKIYANLTEEERELIRQRLQELMNRETEIKEAKALRAEKRAASRAKSLARWTNIGKWAIRVVGFIAIAVAAYYLYQLGAWMLWFLFVRVNWALTLAAWWDFTQHLLLGLLILAAAVLLIVGIVYAVKAIACKIGACLPCYMREANLKKGLGNVFYAIAIPFIYIAKGVAFPFQVIYNYKKDNCPMIEWD